MPILVQYVLSEATAPSFALVELCAETHGARKPKARTNARLNNIVIIEGLFLGFVIEISTI